jgi:hypothetical protein
MWKARPRQTTATELPTERVPPSSAAEVKYPRPKILVLDVPDLTEALRERGYAAKSGSFGQPVVVPKSGSYVPLKPLNLSLDLLNHTEQEIIVANLVGPAPEKATAGAFEDRPAPGVPAVWAPTASGVIDPRPVAMWQVRSAMDRIYEHGGVFILFAGARFEPGCFISELSEYDQLIQPYGDRELRGVDNWSLLSKLSSLRVTGDSGLEMNAADNSDAQAVGIGSYFTDGRFECVVQLSPWNTDLRWVTLATNKYGDPVASVIYPAEEREGTGLIFVLPQVERRVDLVTDLIDRVLPTLTPRLFPHTEGSLWTRRPEYDLPRVSALKDEITNIEEETRIRVRELEEQIKAEREQYGFLHDLVTATSGNLVQAVIRALNTLGFNDVRDVDAEAEAAGETGPLREDLRIMDAAVPVLVEIKGIAGTPKEASSLQVTKYLAPRMREWNRTDIHGLAIVNHQRHRPTLDREHEHVFQTDVITNAEEQGFSLLTAWDLFRLVRGFIMHGWRHYDVAPLFVTPGRVRPIPAHYELIGYIDGYWPQASALGLRLQSGVLGVGDCIAYELPIDFIEDTVTSLQLNDQDVEESKAGDHVGLKTTLSKQQARDGVRVYRLKPRTSGG